MSINIASDAAIRAAATTWRRLEPKIAATSAAKPPASSGMCHPFVQDNHDPTVSQPPMQRSAGRLGGSARNRAVPPRRSVCCSLTVRRGGWDGGRAKPADDRIEDSWRGARLISTTGIGGQDDQEQRAASSLLAVMGAVPEFGRALLAHLDAPTGRIRTFTEIRFKSDDEDRKVSIPDGGIVVERGKTQWRCLVE
jgi:hypothetical protein